MKRLITILAIFAVTVAAAAWSLGWLSQCTDHITAELSRAAAVSEEDPDAAFAQIREIQDYWNRSEPKIGLFVHEEILLEMSDRLERCAALLRYGRIEDFRLEAELAVYAAQNLLHQQLPLPENIF